MSLGKLTIELIEAILTHDVEVVGKMDPYVKFKVRDFRWKSAVHENGGKKPKWSNQHFSIDVKYLGDDIEFTVFDEDRGKDELIGDGETKISAFCVDKHFDEWFDIEFKGKHAGKIHLKSTWEPTHPQHDDITEAQELIRTLVAKRKALEEEYHRVGQTKAAHEAEAAEKLAAIEAEGDDGDFSQRAAEAEAAYQAALESIASQRAASEQAKHDFEKKIAEEIRLAAEARDAVHAGLTAQESHAETEKAEALARAEEVK